MNHKNRWARVRKYIRKRKVGDIITRREIIKHVEGKEKGKEIGIILIRDYSTFDTYLGILKASGALKTIHPGEYKIVRMISEKAPIGKLKHFAYGDWKGWFNNTDLFEY